MNFPTPSEGQSEPEDQLAENLERSRRGPETCADRTEKARAGDSQAWNQIMEIYSPIVDAIFRVKGLPPNDWSSLRNDV
jgi:hypothetical protein